MNNYFYSQLEASFRGSRGLIKARLEVYLPFVRALKTIETNITVLDLGCGRGEWLELLDGNGISAKGVDLDSGMLEEARKYDLQVTQEDVIEYLKKSTDESQSIISAFHLVEHLPFQRLNELIQEAYRVIKPGGIIILETPNPENLVVGTSNFFLDPTHDKPIPPLLLHFLLQFHGFTKIKILRLNEDVKLNKNSNLSITSLIFGVSPDYAVIAQKWGDANSADALVTIFKQEFGVTLESLAGKFDRTLNTHIQNLIDKSLVLAHKTSTLDHQILATQDALRLVEEKIDIANWNTNKALSRVDAYALELQTVYSSRSWLLTRPLRQLKSKYQGIRHAIKRKAVEVLPKNGLGIKILLYARSVMGGGQRKLLVDVSVIAHDDAGTGIQRVVRALLSELTKNPPKYYQVIPIRWCDQLETYLIANKFKSKFFDSGDLNLEDHRFATGLGDIFLGLDLTGDVISSATPWFDKFKANGGNVNFVVYDVLPLTNPEWFNDSINKFFSKWFCSIANNADQLCCISQNVANEVLNQLSLVMQNEKTCNVNWFHLGSDINASKPTKGLPINITNELVDITKKTTFLIVGTLEPRKGHVQVVDAFSKMWLNGSEINLIIAGRNGWGVDKLIKDIENHSELNKKLYWFNQVSDELLELLYSKVDFVIVASEGEGFGLPLIEAIKHNKPIIARNLPVFYEIAGNYLTYFNGKSAEDLVNIITNLPKEKVLIDYKKLNLLSWEQSAEKLKKLL